MKNPFGGPFLTSRKKMLELLILALLDVVIYFISGWEVVALFSMGFIWNWVASQELEALLSNKHYRFSMVKLVKNLQLMILNPLAGAPQFVKWFAAALPAGIFWWLVIFVNDANMPWWATFLGSFFYQILQFEMLSIKKEKEEVV